MDDDYADAIDQTIDAGPALAVGNLDANPDQAARTLDLSGATGVPAAAIALDPEAFEQKHKAMLTGQLIRGNPQLNTYVQSHPLASAVSNDDYGALDNFSRGAGHTSSMLRGLNFPLATVGGAATGAASGFVEGFEGGGIDAAKAEDAQSRLGYALRRSAWMPLDLLSRLVSGVGGAIPGAAEGAVVGGAETLTSDKQLVTSLGREARAMGEYEVTKGEMHAEPHIAAAIAAEPWLREGMEPPTGAHPILDQAKAAANAHALEAVEADIATAQESATKARSPEMFQQFVRQHYGDTEIGISGDAVLGLYGDKVPDPNDGILGWVPGIEDKLAVARDTGGDIRMPLSDWVGKVDPTLAAGLHDDLRMWPGGITAREAQGLEEAAPTIEGPLAQVRGAAGLEPLAAVGDRKITLAPNVIDAYHGSADVIDNFDVDKTRLGRGVFVTEDPEMASRFALGTETDSDPARIYGDDSSAEIHRWLDNHISQAQAAPIKDLIAKADAMSDDDSEKANVADQIHRAIRQYSALDKEAEATPNITKVKANLGRSLPVDMGGRFDWDREEAAINQAKAGGYDSVTFDNTGVGRYYSILKSENVRPTVSIKMVDHTGVEVGQIEFKRVGTDLQVQALTGLDASGFGPSLSADLGRQIKAMYPEAETINGVRLDDPAAVKDAFAKVQWLAMHPEVTAAVPLDLPPEVRSQLAEANDAVRAEVAKITGGKVESAGTIGIKLRGEKALGMFLQYRERAPLVLFDLYHNDAVGVARHEGIHFLRQYGFFTDAEWATLSKAAQEEGWADRYGIHDRYPGLHDEGKIEESIAEGYREWAAAKDANPAAPVAGIFAKMKALWDRLKAKFAPGWEGTFVKIQSGEVGQREGTGPRTEGAAPLAMTPEIKEQLDQIKASAAGLNLQTWKRLQKLIQARFDEDVKASAARKAKEIAKRQTDEWKANYARVQSEVQETLMQRPDIAADRLLDKGKMFDEDVGPVKIRASDLTAEQKTAIPRRYYAEDGLPSDAIGSLFGYGSGDAMVEKLAALKAARGELMPGEFYKKLVKEITDRAMEDQYGRLNENIMSEARGQALSETNLELLAEELKAAQEQAGSNSKWDFKALRENVRENFAKQAIGSIDSGQWMNLVGRHGRDAERALINNDPAAAVVSLQRKTYAALYAAEARKLEQDMAKFDKTAKLYGRVWDPTKSGQIDAHFNLFVRNILGKIQRSTGMTPGGMAQAISKAGFTDLADFVTKTNKDYEVIGLDLPVADFLRDPNFKKGYKELTVDEFRGVKESVDSLIHFGRDISKVEVAGVKQDLRVWVKTAKEQLEAKFEQRPVYGTPTLGSKAANLANRVAEASTSNQTLMSRFDGRDPHGHFTETFTHPSAAADNHQNALEREHAKEYRALGRIEDIKKQIADAPFKTPDGRPLENFTRGNLLAVISNIGNEYNLKTMAKGWGTTPEAILAWVEKHSTREDVDRAHALSKIFDNLKAKSDVVYRQMYGVASENIEGTPFTMHGKDYPGWYHPIIQDDQYTRRLAGQADLMEPETNMWPSTRNGYTKRRTGAASVIDLSYDRIPMQMSQMIHDISHRQVVTNLAKIVRDTEFRRTINGRYGEPYYEGIDAWLKSIAGSEGFSSKSLSLANRISGAARMNVISTQIAFNLGTATKHLFTAAAMSAQEISPNLFKSLPKLAAVTAEVAADSFVHAVKDLYGRSPYSGESLSQFIHRSSEEIQRRDRYWLDSFGGTHGYLEGKIGIRQKISEWGARLVALSDMASAKPLWLAKYREEMVRNGGVHGDAANVADLSVRRAHGSTATSNLPRIVRGNNPITPWMTSLYGFMGTSMQRRIEILHDINDVYKLGRAGEIGEAASKIPAVLSSIAVNVLWVGLVEHMVAGINTEDRRSMGRQALEIAFSSVAVSILGVRDLVNDVIHGNASGGGLLSTPVQDAINLKRSITKPNALGKENAGKLVERSITMLGDLYGASPRKVGQAVHFGMDIYSGEQKPKTAADIYHGLETGSQKLRVVK